MKTACESTGRIRTRAGTGSLHLGITAWAVLLTVGLSGSESAQVRNFARDEGEGDAWFDKARPAYEKSLDAWREAEKFALKVADRASIDRSRRQRAGTLFLLRRAAEFRRLATKLDDASLGAPELTVSTEVARGDSTQLEGELDELVRFFTAAGRAFFRSRDREPRDLPVLFEALGLSHRLVADLRQARGDLAYRRALRAIETSRAELVREMGAESVVVADVRLRFKLRDIEGAHGAFVAGAIDDSRLSRKERIEYLELGRDLARFRGDSTRTLALNDRIIRLGGKAEEQPAPKTHFSTFVRGRPAALAAVAKTLLKVGARFRLAPRERALVTYLAGLATLEAGQPALAMEILLRVSDEDCGEPWLRAQTASRLAQARERTGDYEAALAAYQKAGRDVADLTAVETFAARVALNSSALLLMLGDFVGASRQADTVLTARGVPRELGVRARILRGDVFYHTPQLDPALERQQLEDALAAYRRAGDDLQAADLDARRADAALVAELKTQIDIHVGNCHRRLALLENDTKKAADMRRRAIEVATAAYRRATTESVSWLDAVAAANLGELYLEEGDLKSAREHTSWSLARAQERRYTETEWRARWYLGRIADREGQTATASAEYERAADLIETSRARILDAARKSGFMSSKQRFFEDLVRRHLQLGDVPGAFAAAERARSRAFIESLGLRFLLLAADRDRQLYREYVELVSRAEAARRPDGKVFGVGDSSIEDYQVLRRRVKELRERIRRHPGVSQLVRSLVAGEPADLGTVQASLPAAEVLVEYFSTGKTLMAFVVGSNVARVFDLELSPRDVSRLVTKFLDGGAGEAALAEELHRRLVAPALAAVGEASGEADATVARVSLVPWGPLHRLPFEALRQGDRYLLESWEIVYLPSATVLKYLPREPASATPPATLVALVDPDTDYDGDGQQDFPALPYAKVEVDGIRPFFRDTSVLVGQQAMEDLAMRVSPTRDVVHLACHGEFFPSRPLDSTLYLSRGDATDGKLRAVEILGLDLRRSRLVTLSGCETGRLDVAPGDDPVGIGTAFLHTGARALLVSLWKVEDQATAELMLKFYGKWLRQDHGSRARALRDAKLELLRGGRFAHPRQWAAFVLIGVR